MRSLYILRHGTAEWTSPGGDRERPLQDRGRTEARTIGLYLSELGEAPQLILASNAVRASETVELARESGGWTAEVRVESRLYEASLSTLLEVVNNVEGDIERLLLCGHQPVCGLLIGELTRTRAPDFPTASLARIDAEIASWAELDRGKGQLEWLMSPGGKTGTSNRE